jgi:hypothetical protein
MEQPGPEKPEGFFTLRPVSLDLGDVAVQIVAVALGVVLGFAVTAWQERVHQGSLLRETVGNIVAELRSNQSGMRGVTAEHAKAAEILARLEKNRSASATISLAEARKALRATGPMRVNVPLGIAWQIAQNDQGLTLLPYEDRYGLAWVYQVQSIYYEKEERYENSLLDLQQSPDGNYYFEVVNLANQLQSVVAIEKQLDALYSQAIRRAKSEFKFG